MAGNLATVVKLQGTEDGVLLGGDCCPSMQVFHHYSKSFFRQPNYRRLAFINIS